MKKRFVAKQVGVLSLTAVLAGNAGCKCTCRRCVCTESRKLTKEMLEQAVATENKIKILLWKTVHG